MWEKECKFKDAQCYECKVKGHTAPICPKKNRVHPVQEEQEEEFLFKMTSDKDSARREIFVNPLVSNQTLKMEVDTGSGVSIIPLGYFKQMFNNKRL